MHENLEERYDPADRPRSSFLSSESSSPPPKPHFTYPTPHAEPARPALRSRKSLLDEIIPLPSASSVPTVRPSSLRVIRRAGSLAVVSVFMLSIIFMAATEGGRHTRGGLRRVFGVGSDAGIGGAGWVAQDLGEVSHNDGGGLIEGQKNGAVGRSRRGSTGNMLKNWADFDRYQMMRTLLPQDIDITTPGKRVIFVGDIHGSFSPFL